MTVEAATVKYVSGPLIFVSDGDRYPLGGIVEILDPGGGRRRGQVLEAGREHAVIQVLEDTSGLDVVKTRVVLTDDAARIAVGPRMIGRVFTGSGLPRDGLPPFVAEKSYPIEGMPINPVSRSRPSDFIQTGITSIDLFNTLVRGQKLPIFSGSGLPANEIVSQIIANADVPNAEGDFVVVFGAMGLTVRDYSYFTSEFAREGSLDRTIVFMNLADDPTIERLLTPRCALTTAEVLAFEYGYHVLVLLSDMTNYCEALREVGAAREEIPGRRGYPGYMYTDLASIYERAGQVKGKKGSVTQIPVLTMPNDDITHPIPDLTGYITEGQIVLQRELHRAGIEPPVDVLSSLSRLMNSGIGEGKTRKDHRELANQLYACYARGRDLLRLVAIIGEEALSEYDRKYLEFSEAFDKRMIGQGTEARTIEESLALGWEILSVIPAAELTRLSKDTIAEFLNPLAADGNPSPYLEKAKGG
ncbi:MAG: V-type ATP synthase subunit B [Lentisphaerae bacterium]|nr:V-type ATP synthase subunit B [Lentisphaerota bacterium]